MNKKTNKHIALAVWSAGIVLLFAALVLLSNLVFHSIHGDATADGRYSLDIRTIDFLKKNKEPVTVRLYISKNLAGQNQVLGNYADYVRRLLDEYQRISRGTIDISVVETVPFEASQAAAQKAGIKEFDFGDGKKYLYLGASFTNGEGKTLTIPKFLPERQKNIEDDISRIVSALVSDRQPVLGIVSPFFNMSGGSSVWRFSIKRPFVEQLKGEGYKIRILDSVKPDVFSGIDTVLVFYPLNLKMSAVYALDQYLLNGGKIAVVLDAFAEGRFKDGESFETYNSGLEEFLSNKGVVYAKDLVVGDLENNRELPITGKSEKYPFWLSLDAKRQKVLLNHSGFFKYSPQKGFLTKVLLETGNNSVVMPANAVQELTVENFDKNYQKTQIKYPLALLLEGKFASIFDEAQIYDIRDLKQPRTFLQESAQNGKLALIGDSDMFGVSAWKNNALSGSGFYETVFVSDNMHFLRNIIDYLTDTALIGTNSKKSGLKGMSASDIFYRYAIESFRVEKTTTEEKLAEIQRKIAALQKQLKAVPAASVKQTKDLEQLRREEIEAQETLRRIDYQTAERHKSLMTRLSFLVIGMLPLLCVLTAGGAYWLYRRMMKEKVKKYVER